MTDATSDPRTASASRPGGRDRLISAAEELFAARGIEGVSLREITRVAGQRNNSALQYHFGDRAGLLRAVVDKHRSDTEPSRHALLDEYEADGSADLHLLSVALVEPLVAKLADPDGGRAYLQINAEVFTRPTGAVELMPGKGQHSSIRRWHDLANDALPEEEGILHFRFPALRFAFVELGRRAAEPPRRDDRLFSSYLVDLVASLLATRPSPATATLLAERDEARHRRERGSSS